VEQSWLSERDGGLRRPLLPERTRMTYHFSKTIAASFDSAIQHVIEALKRQ
jgi:hypothetical protein